MDSSRLDHALERVDAANAEDPRRVELDGKELPRELVYGRRMSRWLERLAPEASEELRIAVRAQHVCRWTIPRTDFPMNREGYLEWRKTLGKFHATRCGEILAEIGYDETTIERVRSLLRKENLKTDDEAQTLEDTACLVFLEEHLADFARQHDEDKLVRIVRKTWKKMSARGHEEALKIELGAEEQRLVEKALEPYL